MKRFGKILGCGAIAALLMSCGSDDDTGGASATTTPTVSTDAATTNAPTSEPRTDVTGAPDTSSASSAPAAPSGDPIVIASVSSDTGTGANPAAGDALQAWANYVNANGGVIGRPVEISRCDDQLDVQKHSTCARDAANDPAVLAIAGSQSRFTGNTGAKIYEEFGLSLICGNPASADEFASPNAFCISGGFTTGMNAGFAYLAAQGAKSTGIIVPDSAGGQSSAKLIAALAEAHGISSNAAFISVTSPDYLPAATALVADDPDAVMVGFAPDQELQMLQALTQAGWTKPVLTGETSITADVAKDPSADKIYVGGSFPSTSTSEDPEMDLFRQAMADEGKANEIGPASLGAWLSGRVLEKIITTLGSDNVTREDILEVVKTGTVTGVPLLPDLSRSFAPTSTPLPGLANPTAIVQQIIDGGQLVDVPNTSVRLS